MIIVDSRRTATESGAYVRLIRLCTLDKTQCDVQRPRYGDHRL